MDYYYRYETVDDMCADMGEGARDLWPEYVENRARYGHPDDEHVEAWRASDAYAARPFRFEDLSGNPEPDSWGPTYPTAASQSVEKWRRLSTSRELTEGEKAAYGAAVHVWINSLNRPKKTPGTLPTTSNCASGQPFTFNAAKHRAKIMAELHAAAARDRRELAEGKRQTLDGWDLEHAYAHAPKYRPPLAMSLAA